MQNADSGCLRTRWDFSRVTAALIPSLHGKHEGWDKVIKTGHTALMRAVRRLSGIDSKDKRGRRGTLEYQVERHNGTTISLVSCADAAYAGLFVGQVQLEMAERVLRLCDGTKSGDVAG